MIFCCITVSGKLLQIFSPTSESAMIGQIGLFVIAVVLGGLIFFSKRAGIFERMIVVILLVIGHFKPLLGLLTLLIWSLNGFAP